MNRAPEPTAADIALASKATASYVFRESDARLTVAYYRRLCALGPLGVIAMNLFRASKTSARAKVYRGHKYRSASYDTKNYSLTELCKVLDSQMTWGWKRDPHTPGFHWVLYVDLPNGQVSFHSADRGKGPDYPGEWDHSVIGTSAERVMQFCDFVLGETDEQSASGTAANVRAPDAEAPTADRGKGTQLGLPELSDQASSEAIPVDTARFGDNL